MFSSKTENIRQPISTAPAVEPAIMERKGLGYTVVSSIVIAYSSQAHTFLLSTGAGAVAAIFGVYSDN